VLPNGRRIPQIRVEFHILAYVSSCYITAYFVLVCFLTLILSGATSYTTNCKLHIYEWFEVSAAFYIACFILGMIIYLVIRRHGLTLVTVNMGRCELLFLDYSRIWAFVALVLIDLVHLGLTVWGTVEFVTDLHGLLHCYIEAPLLSNFMFMCIIIGYLYSVRLFITVIHFKYGIRILRNMRQRCRCFRRYD